MQPYSLLLEAAYRDAIWGGNRLADFQERDANPGRHAAEAWEISTRPEGPSRVVNGPLAGLPLSEVLPALGVRSPFPLLFKLIDARKALSIQVHPDETGVTRHGGEPKTEMWVVLHAEPGAVLYAGLRDGIDRQRLRDAIRQGRLPECLRRFPVHPGEAMVIPGGLVHAIGAGCLLYEVQQNSDTTYRLYDWDRVNADGRPRELHIEQALDVIQWDLPPPELIAPTPANIDRAPVARHRCFVMDRLRLGVKPVAITPAPGRLLAVFTEAGVATLHANGQTVTLPRGRHALLIDQTAECRRASPEDASLLLTTI